MAAETAVAVVQARMGSSRFPGKSLARFGESTVLQEIVRALRRVEGLDVWVATSDVAEDDPLVERCADEGVAIFRGSRDDVLDRVAACLEALPEQPELVVRICADRPFLTPALVADVLDAYAELDRPDYVSNNLVRSYPDGLDVEVVRVEALLEAARETDDPYDREHVTPFVYRHPERYALAGLTCPWGDYSSVDLALDTPEDYERLTRLRALVGEDADYLDVLNVVAVHPELAA